MKEERQNTQNEIWRKGHFHRVSIGTSVMERQLCTYLLHRFILGTNLYRTCNTRLWVRISDPAGIVGGGSD